MPFELGNTHGAKAKLVYQELRKAALRDDRARLRAGCEKLMDAFAEGQPWALQMVMDRLDGKPAQQVIATDQDGRGLAVAILNFNGDAGPEVRPDDTVQLQAPALPAPIPEGDGQRH